jgi:hypothetical protein
VFLDNQRGFLYSGGYSCELVQIDLETRLTKKTIKLKGDIHLGIVVGEYLFASSMKYLEVFVAKTLHKVKNIAHCSVLAKMLPFHHKGADYVDAFDKFTCEIFTLNARTLEKLSSRNIFKNANIFRDVCIVDFSKGTFAIAIHKGFTLLTIDIE